MGGSAVDRDPSLDGVKRDGKNLADFVFADCVEFAGGPEREYTMDAIADQMVYHFAVDRFIEFTFFGKRSDNRRDNSVRLNHVGLLLSA